MKGEGIDVPSCFKSFHLQPMIPASRMPKNELELQRFAHEEKHLLSTMVIIASRHDSENPTVHEKAWEIMSVSSTCSPLLDCLPDWQLTTRPITFSRATSTPASSTAGRLVSASSSRCCSYRKTCLDRRTRTISSPRRRPTRRRGTTRLSLGSSSVTLSGQAIFSVSTRSVQYHRPTCALL